MDNFRDELSRLDAELAQKEKQRTLLDAQITGLRAERDALTKAGTPTSASDHGGLAHLTIDKAIIEVLRRALPDEVQVREIERRMEAGGKRAAGGISVNLHALKSAKRVINTRWGYYTIPAPQREAEGNNSG
jgi:chromosome segregation ATPase